MTAILARQRSPAGNVPNDVLSKHCKHACNIAAIKRFVRASDEGRIDVCRLFRGGRCGSGLMAQDDDCKAEQNDDTGPERFHCDAFGNRYRWAVWKATWTT